MSGRETNSRLGKGPFTRVAGLVGGSSRHVARWSPIVHRISGMEPELAALTDAQLRKKSLSLRYRAASGEPLKRMLVEAYALVREAARRTVEMRHFDVQLLGGVALFHGSVAEMETGEGKTLTATLPLYIFALVGKGSQLATVNDYLAQRDAEWMGPIYKLLGLSTGVIQTGMTTQQRRKAYACDIVYGSAKEFGFDFLRDRLLLRRMHQTQGGIFAAENGKGGGDQPVQREPFFVLVDEADSVLIDEARTPLIISAIPGEAQKRAVHCAQWCAEHVGQFNEDEHYDYDNEKKSVELNAGGRELLRALPKPEELNAVGLANLYEFMERAIRVDRDYHRDQQYVVRDDEVVIVDESTGRLAEGRKWRDGIHQAVEAKEGVEVTVDAGQAARVTVQDFFLRYKHLAGMTGTARTSAREFRKFYKLKVVAIPTNRPSKRERQKVRVFGSADAKWAAIVEDIKRLHAMRRPVLVGTRSIDKSEHLSKLLSEANVEHQVLNAHKVAEEAEIVAQAGAPGRVTVATNMAGRGTDIKLGEGVHELGGLHVICTELHDSARIDRQLIGRCGRQGDPGSYQIFMALDDEVLRTAYGLKKAKRMARGGSNNGKSHDGAAGIFRRAQKKVERRHFRQRAILLYHDKQRKKLQLEMGQDPFLDTVG